jgi:hypothetical protein
MWCPESRHLMRKVPLACLRSSLLSATGWDVLPIGILSLPGAAPEVSWAPPSLQDRLD